MCRKAVQSNCNKCTLSLIEITALKCTVKQLNLIYFNQMQACLICSVLYTLGVCFSSLQLNLFIRKLEPSHTPTSSIVIAANVSWYHKLSQLVTYAHKTLSGSVFYESVREELSSTCRRFQKPNLHQFLCC